MSYSFNQCEMTSSAHPRPTSILSLSPPRDPLLRKGWPKLADEGRRYLGPLNNTANAAVFTNLGTISDGLTSQSWNQAWWHA